MKIVIDNRLRQVHQMEITNCWDEHLTYPRKDWAFEVNENNTNLGYWDWVSAQIVARENEGDYVCETCGYTFEVEKCSNCGRNLL